MLKKRISKSIATFIAAISVKKILAFGATVATATSTGRGMYLKIGPGVFTFGTL